MAPGDYSLSHSLIWAVSGLSLISGKGPHAETCSYPSSGAPAAPGNQPSPRDKNRNKTLPDSKPQWGMGRCNFAPGRKVFCFAMAGVAGEACHEDHLKLCRHSLKTLSCDLVALRRVTCLGHFPGGLGNL